MDGRRPRRRKPRRASAGRDRPVSGILPLQALVAREDRIADIVAPQYEFIPRGDRYGYAVRRPDSFVNIILSVRDFPPPPPTRAAVARRAADHFESMLDRGLFETLPAPAFFLYELDTGRHRQLGIVAGLPLSAVAEGRVIGHEETFEERVEDLARSYRTARLASSPIALGFRPDGDQLGVMERLARRQPIRDFTGGDGVRQRLWMVADAAGMAELGEAAARIGAMYITDGHHRVAAVCRDGASPGWLLAILYPADHLRAMAYNRSVRLDRSPSIDHVTRVLGGKWEVGAIGPAGTRPRVQGEISMLLDGVWWRLAFRGERSADPVGRLDVSLLHDLVLGPAFGVASHDDPRIAYVAGRDALSRLETHARSGGAAGFALHPTHVEEMMAVADAGRLMPPKSTWFTPKPRSGLLVVCWDRIDAVAGVRSPGGTAPP